MCTMRTGWQKRLHQAAYRAKKLCTKPRNRAFLEMHLTCQDGADDMDTTQIKRSLDDQREYNERQYRRRIKYGYSAICALLRGEPISAEDRRYVRQLLLEVDRWLQ